MHFKVGNVKSTFEVVLEIVTVIDLNKKKYFEIIHETLYNFNFDQVKSLIASAQMCKYKKHNKKCAKTI